jgi:hypothetical protein
MATGSSAEATFEDAGYPYSFWTADLLDTRFGVPLAEGVKRQRFCNEHSRRFEGTGGIPDEDSNSPRTGDQKK